MEVHRVADGSLAGVSRACFRSRRDNRAANAEIDLNEVGEFAQKRALDFVKEVVE
jgi:hypothetical protein